MARCRSRRAACTGMSDLPDPPPMTIWSPGFNSWGHRCKLAAGTLSVTTDREIADADRWINEHYLFMGPSGPVA